MPKVDFLRPSKAQEIAEITEAVQRAVTDAAQRGEPVVVIASLNIQVNFASGGGATVAVKN